MKENYKTPEMILMNPEKRDVILSSAFIFDDFKLIGEDYYY